MPSSPWRAVGRFAGWVFTSSVRQPPAHLKYPSWLGRWPAAVGLVAFVWLEIVYGVSGGVAVGVIPHDAAVATVLYSLWTFSMMARFGTEKWSANGETFSVFFGCSRSCPRSRRATGASDGGACCREPQPGHRSRARSRS